MSKRLIRENIITTRALIGCTWQDVAELYLGSEGKKIRAFKFVFLPYPSHHRDGEPVHEHVVEDEDYAEVIALIGAPLSHKQHIKRIGRVMERVAIRSSDRMKGHYSKEEPHEAEVRRRRAVDAEKSRLRKLSRIQGS